MNTSNKTIAVVGPVYPYKGGIAHYTGLLVREMEKRFRVHTISYSMQYPKLLFKKEQKDYDNDSFRVDAEFILNTASPVSILKTAGRINSLNPDLVIVQWWHPYFAPCYRILAGKLKARLMFICHNVFPHERFVFDRFLTKLTLKCGDFFILHSSKEVSELKSIIKKPVYRVNMHPTYSAFDFSGDAYPGQSASGQSHGERRGNGRTLLFFGFVRPYKGLKYLLNAMKELDEDIKLMVVGDFGNDRASYDAQIEELGIADRLEIHDEYVPDKQVELYFKSCDAVVLPYIDATQSGIAQIAFGFKKPVIATDVGGLPEVVTDGITGIVCKSADSRALADGINRFYELRRTVDFAANIEKDSRRFSWEQLVDTIVNVAFNEGSSV